MSHFSSTLDLPNLQGFDKGIPTQFNSSNNYLKVFLGILFLIIFFVYINAIQAKNNKFQDKDIFKSH